MEYIDGSGSGYGIGSGDGGGYGSGYGYGYGIGSGGNGMNKEGNKMQYFRDGLTQEIDTQVKVKTTREGHTVEEYLVDGVKKYFVTLAGSHYCAHGSSVGEAISDAIWKDESKRPTLNDLKKEILAAGSERKITLQEFRVLTGACLEGCRIALTRAGLSGEPMLPKEILNHFPDWGTALYRVLEAKEE